MRNLVIITAVLLSFGGVFAQGVTVTLHGDSPLSAGKIKTIYQSYQIDSVAQSEIRDTLAALAFPEAEVELQRIDQRTEILIDPGPLYRIDSIKVIGDSVARVVEIDLLGVLAGEPASSSVITRAGESIVEHLSNSGYPFGQASIEQVTVKDGNRIDVVLRGTSGPLTAFSGCTVAGINDATGEYLCRISGIDTNDVFSDDAVAEARWRIEDHRFVSLEDSIELDFANGLSKCEVIFHAKPRSSNLVEGSLGYQPETAGRDGYVKGFLRAEFENILHRGRTISIYYNKKDPLSHEVSFGYTQPYVFYKPVTLDLSVSQIKYDSLYQQLSAEATGEYTGSQFTSVRISSGWSRYTPTGSRFLGVFHSRRLWWGLGVTLRSEDMFEQLIDLDVRYGVKQQYAFAGVSPADHRVDDTRITGSYSASAELTKSVSVSSLLDGGSIVSEESSIPPTDLFRLGGARKLRGYREDQFLTDRYAFGSCQPQLNVTTGLAMRVFADAAWFRQASGESIVRFGSGGGLVIDIATGQLVMDIAWGRDDTLGDGKFYVILESRF